MSSSLVSTLITSFPYPNNQRAIKTRTHQPHGLRVSCNATPNDHKHKQNLILPDHVDRRNLLVGLGGLYTAANLTSLPEATAEPTPEPITTPEITSKCLQEVKSGFSHKDPKACTIRSKNCCPPDLKKTAEPFKFPTENTERMRWPAHKGTPDQVDKYRRAIQAMKDLPDDDPRSFVNQAKIHCAYCHGAYTQSGEEIQIHDSWLFFPFHRMYLYFYERILGKLIDDPSFALPYWNWDDPAGMQMPEIFVNGNVNGKINPLYDQYRDASHLPPEIVDLSWTPGNTRTSKLSDKKQKACNLSTVYRELVRTEGEPLSFFGGVYVAGSPAVKLPGSAERGSHTAVHVWVGDSNLSFKEDMGRFYSAGYDPLFYCHHANVDRMWKLWNDLSPENVEPKEQEWLDASYLFYDENKNLVRVYNRDAVSLKNLKYNYIEESKEVFPWRKGGRPPTRNPSDQVGEDKGIKTVEETTFPLTLDVIRKVRVQRPAVQKNDEEKANMPNENLVIDGIIYDCTKFVKFDVFVNDILKNNVFTTPCDPEYAGCFAQIPHGDENKSSMLGAVNFGLKELLQLTGTTDQEYATVTMVPRTGCEDLTIGQITITNPKPSKP